MPSRLTQLKYSAFFIKSKICVCFKPSLVSKSAAFFIKHKKAYFLKSDFLSGLFLVIPFSGFGGIYFILEHELSRFVLVYVRSVLPSLNKVFIIITSSNRRLVECVRLQPLSTPKLGKGRVCSTF